ncbi:MAG: DNA-binding protein WhiA [Solobacterium sp.]|jgi:DNA-binding protein WhiA|nr:DNA-binding protein WhiA [Solobacterium sp.]MCH4222148.1 DNA-binding protein WhiA [Solobacterium sp.]
MSFTADVKQEVSLHHLEMDDGRAELSALVKMTSSLSISSGRGMTLLVRTENAPVSRLIVRLFKERYQVEIEPFVQRKMNLRKNLIYGLRIYGDITAILRDLGLYSPRGLLEKPLQKIVSRDTWVRSYLAGAFMAEGSVNSPTTASYHLEINAGSEKHALFLVDLMAKFNIPAHTIERRGRTVVYVKQAEKIGDFLRCIGADQCVMQFEDTRISRDLANSVQRLNNVEIANGVKSLKAGTDQMRDIAILEEAGLIDKLDDKLKDVIELRKNDPEGSLNELAEKYMEQKHIQVSKSGMKHRFNRIHELAEKAEGK